MENKINSPKKSDYRRFQDFSDSLVAINSSLTKLNNHIEVLKRYGDVDALHELDAELFDFRVSIIESYYNNLKDDINENQK